MNKKQKTIAKNLPKATNYYLTKSTNQRSLYPEKIIPFIEGHCICIENYKEAFDSILSRINEKDMVIITGSAFLVGDILNDFY